jgi:AcrR family transcriptional regulator
MRMHGQRGPKPTQVRHRDSVSTRARILQTAGQVFAEAGLAGARTEAIAAAAGVNKALLYYYFKSKDGLYQAVLDDHLKEFSRRAVEILSAGDSPGPIILRYVSYHFDFIGARQPGEKETLPGVFGQGVLNFDELIPEVLRAGCPTNWWTIDLCFWPDAWEITAEAKAFLERLAQKWAA